jgi:hypothetical protein
MAIATPFIVIFTDVSYVASGVMLSYLMAWVLIKSLYKPYLVHFGGFNRPIFSSVLSMITLPLSIVLNLIFIPDSILGVPMLGMGPKGAAIAAVVGAMIGYLVVRYMSYKLIPIGINISVVKHLGAGIVMSVTIYVMEHWIYAFERWYDLFLFGVIGAAIYLALIWAMGEFKRSDLLFFIDTVSATKMYDYLRSELFGGQ